MGQNHENVLIYHVSSGHSSPCINVNVYIIHELDPISIRQFKKGVKRVFVKIARANPLQLVVLISNADKLDIDSENTFGDGENIGFSNHPGDKRVKINA